MVMVNRAPPVVSVVISTFNWSSVLRYAITSVLAQSFEDFELIVVGDCCTDDSEAVVKSFDDPRIRWHNLAEHAGGQFGPNNQGVALARGRYIAYLGHDDLWHRDHLAVLVAAIEAHKADLVFAITEDIGPPAMPTRGLLGLAPKGVYEWSLWDRVYDLACLIVPVEELAAGDANVAEDRIWSCAQAPHRRSHLPPARDISDRHRHNLCQEATQ
jgi:glycosyltransferase involved in cell wall biosynthesis